MLKIMVLKIIVRWMLVGAWLVALTGHAYADAAINQAYRLGAGDEIEVLVYGEDDMTVKTRLGDSGVISYPFLGAITAKGLTVSELEQLLVRGLKGSYLVDPEVSINIIEYRPFFVNGEVNKPGAIPFQPSITLRKAIAMAGGFTERASRVGGELMRGSESKAKPLGLDDQIQPGDIVTVKQSFF